MIGESVMFSRKRKLQFMAALAAAGIFAVTTAQAAFLAAPVATSPTPDIESAWCAVGAHVAPLGACVGNVDYYYGHPRYYGHPGYYGHAHYAYRHCWINRWGHRVCG
jgi:hypothetical protein